MKKSAILAGLLRRIEANRQGFTLIELIVVFGIFAVIVVIVTNYLVSMVRSNNRTTIQNEVRQNAAKMMEDISSEIRNAGCVEPEGNVLTIYSEPGCDPADPGIVKFEVGNNGVMTKTVNDVAAGTLTSDQVAVCKKQNCSDSLCVPGLEATSDGTGVKVKLTVQQASLGNVRSDFCAKVSLESTISPRNAQN